MSDDWESQLQPAESPAAPAQDDWEAQLQPVAPQAESPGPHPLPTTTQVREPDGTVAPIDTTLTAWRAAHREVTPQQAGELAAQQKATGLTWQVLDGNVDVAKRAQDAQALGGLMQHAPGAQAFLENPNRGAFAKAEPGVLGALAWGVTGSWEMVPRQVFGKTVEAPEWKAPAWWEALRDSFVDVTQRRRLQTLDALGTATPDDIALLNQLNRELDGKDYGAEGDFAKAYLKVVQAIPNVVGNVAAIASGAEVGADVATPLGAGAGALAGLPVAGVGAVPGAAVGATGAAATGAFLGGRVGDATWNFLQMFGPAYERYRAKGYPVEDARRYARDEAAIGAGLFAAFGGLVGKIPGVQRLIARQLGEGAAAAVEGALQKASRTEVLRDVLVRQGTGAIEVGGLMAANTAVSRAYENYVARDEHGEAPNWDNLGHDALQAWKDGILISLGLGALPGGAEWVEGLRGVKRLEDDARQMEVLHTAAADSELVKKHPSEAAELLRLSQGDKPLTYFGDLDGWNEYWRGQGVDPGAMAAHVLGDDGRAYAEAMQTHGEVAIPAEKYLTRFAQTEHLRGMEDFFRLSQDGLSLRQVRLIDEATPREEGDGSEEIEKDWAAKGVATGRVEPKAAKDVAKGISAFFRTLAKESGTGWTPLQLYRLYDVKMFGDEDTSFGFGEGAAAAAQAPSADTLAKAKEAIGRMRPANQEMATAWLEYVTGQREKRPVVTPAMERRFASDWGLADPEGYGYDINGRSLERTLGGRRNARAGAGQGGMQGMPEELRRIRMDSIDDYYGQPAWHGTPHDFEQFSLEHVGSGEGAQVYGHGLYFAGKRGVAEYYKGKLSRPEVIIRGKDSDAMSFGEKQLQMAIRDELINRGGTLEVAVERVRKDSESTIRHYEKRAKDAEASIATTEALLAPGLTQRTRDIIERELRDHRQELDASQRMADASRAKLDTLNSIKPGSDEIRLESTGKLFHVDLPEDHELLDYDKPLTEQPPKVLDALKRAGRVWESEKTPGTLWTWTSEPADAVTGRELYRSLGDPKAASEALRAAGIPGLRYLDQGSRGSVPFLHFDGMPLYDAAAQGAGLSRMEGDILGLIKAHFDKESIYNPKLTLEQLLQRVDRGGYIGDAPEARDAFKRLSERLEVVREKDTHNYVLFDDSRVKVLNKLGQPHFRLDAGGGERGYITFGGAKPGEPRSFNLHLLEGADASTFAHETMHFLGEVLADVATAEGASEGLKRDYGTLLSYMGFASHEERQAAAEERKALSAKGEDRTPEENARLKELTGREEKLTHAWELYLAEGRAPTPEMAGVFARFREWMKGIYKSLLNIQRQYETNFGKPLALSDDVRRVFDRLLGADQALQDAREAFHSGRPLDRLVEAMAPEEREAYLKTAGDAANNAHDELVRRIAYAQRQANTAFMRGERARLAPDVEEQLGKDSVLRTLRYFEKGDLPEHPGDVPPLFRAPSGEPLKLDRAALVKRFGRELVSSLPRYLFAPKGEGVELEQLAGMLGWESGPKMLEAIQGQPRYTETLKAAVEQQLGALYGPSLLDNPQQLASEAAGALHNEKEVEKAFLELHALRRMLDKGAPNVVALDRKTAEETAIRLVGSKLVGEVLAGDQGLAGRYLRAERTAAARSFRALERGDVATAYAEKSTQVLNLALYREAFARREELERAQDTLSRPRPKDAWKDAPGVLRDAHDTILQAMGLQRPQAGVEPPSMDGFQAWAEANPELVGFDLERVRKLVESPPRYGWRMLSVDDALDVRDAVLGIRHVANEAQDIVADGKRQALDDWFDEVRQAAMGHRDSITEPASRIRRTLAERVAEKRRGGDAYLATVETMAQVLDGKDNRNGPMQRLFVDQRLAAREKERELQAKVLAFIYKQYKEMPAALRALRDQAVEVDLPAPQGSRLRPEWSRDTLWSLFLNWGNEGNRQRLRDGNGFTDAQVQKALSILKPEEVRFLKGIVDGIELLKGDLMEAHERRTGLPMQLVQDAPFHVNGQQVRGGYFPIKYDSRVSRAGSVQEESIEASLKPQGYTSPTVYAGHRKSRLETVKQPIDLTFGVVPAHISQVIHDIAYGDWVRDAAKVVLDERFKAIVSEHLGPEYHKEFLPWLRDVATARADSAAGTLSEFNKQVSGFTRSKTAVATLAWNWTTLVPHFMDPLTARVSGVELSHIAKAYAKTIGRGVPVVGKAMIDPLDGIPLSKEMAFREAQFQSNLRKTFQEMGPTGNDFLHTVEELAFKPHEWLEHFTSAVLYRAAFEQAMSGGKTKEEAVSFADDQLRRNLPAGDIADKSRILRDKRGLGAVALFYGYANKLYNLMSVSVHQDSPAVFAAKLLYLGAVGAGASYLAGRGPQPDENRLKWLALKVALDPFNLFPVAGGLVEGLVLHGKADARSAPEAAFFADLLNRVHDVWKQNTDGKHHHVSERLLGAVRLLGGTGPATLIKHTGGYAGQLSAGKAHPRGTLDVASGFLYGHRKGQPANPLTDLETAATRRRPR